MLYNLNTMLCDYITNLASSERVKATSIDADNIQMQHFTLSLFFFSFFNRNRFDRSFSIFSFFFFSILSLSDGRTCELTSDRFYDPFLFSIEITI